MMIRILIVDDQKLVREGIKILLEKKSEIEVVGDVADARVALEKIEILQPDVILLDIDMPEIDGLTLAQQIGERFPQIKVIMLSSHEEESYVQKATELGAKGYLLKNASSQELEWSIRLVHRGYSAIKSELLEKQFVEPKEPKLDLASDKNLSKQQEVNSDSTKVTTSVLSREDRANLDKLELLLAKKQVQEKYHTYQKQKNKRNPWVHGVKATQTKKTIQSFEFKLLVFIILSCLGFLVAVALS